MADNEQLHQMRAHFQRLEEQRERFLEQLGPACPEDGKQGAYLHEWIGNPQIAVPVFQCPQGHIFSYRLSTQGAAIIPPERWEAIQNERRWWNEHYEWVDGVVQQKPRPPRGRKPTG